MKDFGFHFNFTDEHYFSKLEVIGHTTGLVCIKDSGLVHGLHVDPEEVESVTLGWDQIEALHQILGQLLQEQKKLEAEKKTQVRDRCNR